MTSLSKPILGTPEGSWQFYPLHLTTSYLLKEFFSASYYKQCVKIASKSSKNGLDLSEKCQAAIGQDLPNIKHVGELYRWTVEVEKDAYHEMHTHGFIGMYSVFESGLENIVAEIIRHDKGAAEKTVARFNKKKFDIKDWPWNQEDCLVLAGQLERLAIKESVGRGFFSRIKALFKLVEIDLFIDEKDQCIIADIHEANEVRNIILHRYGVVSERDAEKVPTLEPWVGETVVMDDARYRQYFHAMKCLLLSISKGMASSRYMRDLG